MKVEEKHLGVCLETQVAPDNIEEILLDAGEMYQAKTKFTFKTN